MSLVGYSYFALMPLWIGSVLAFAPGQLVPDSTVSAQGWTVGVQVDLVSNPQPAPQLFEILADTDGNPYMKAV